MQLKFGKKPEKNDDYSQIKKEVIREYLRQLRHSYNLALVITAASTLMTLLGVGLLYGNKVSQATFTAFGGFLATDSRITISEHSYLYLNNSKSVVSLSRANRFSLHTYLP
ncbi:MAG: hypothetical protein QNJ36_15460 [Calothrix sp. MO_167.B42]|nr:hypothetical protein [Calothrix sp. MO_167.B42]